MQMSFSRFIVALCVVLLSVIALYMGQLFISYSNASSTAYLTSRGIDSLHISQTNAIPQNGNPTFQDMDVTNAQNVQQFYNFLTTLPPVQNMGARSCPVDFGLTYHFQFLQGSTQVHQADARITGCRSVTLDNGDVRMLTDEFWSQLANVTGLPMSELLPNMSTRPIYQPVHHCHSSMMDN